MVVGGREAGEWFRMYRHTHPGNRRIEWPDGGCYMAQEHLLVDVFELISGVVADYHKEQRKQ